MEPLENPSWFNEDCESKRCCGLIFWWPPSTRACAAASTSRQMGWIHHLLRYSSTNSLLHWWGHLQVYIEAWLLAEVRTQLDAKGLPRFSCAKLCVWVCVCVSPLNFLDCEPISSQLTAYINLQFPGAEWHNTTQSVKGCNGSKKVSIECEPCKFPSSFALNMRNVTWTTWTRAFSFWHAACPNKPRKGSLKISLYFIDSAPQSRHQTWFWLQVAFHNAAHISWISHPWRWPHVAGCHHCDAPRVSQSRTQQFSKQPPYLRGKLQQTTERVHR